MLVKNQRPFLKSLAFPSLIACLERSDKNRKRAMDDDCPDRLKRFLFPLEQEAWTEELACLDANYAAAEMLLSGVTTAVGMYEEVIRAFLTMGLRSFPGEMVICQKAPAAMDFPLTADSFCYK